MTREEVIEYLENIKYINAYHRCREGIAIDKAIEEIQKPEKKKGHWKDFDCGNSYECTYCGEIWTLNDGTPEENNMNYCPKCGADMRGKQE